jgi:hypothetical protein
MESWLVNSEYTKESFEFQVMNLPFLHNKSKRETLYPTGKAIDC